MSTHAYIGIENPDSTVEFLYCHFDGHPNRMVPTLTTWWVSPKEIRKLIAKGAIRGLKDDLFHTDVLENPPDDLHKVGNADFFAEYTSQLGGSYAYLFRSGIWTILDPSTSTWTPCVGR